MIGETQDEPETSARSGVWVWLCWLAGIVVLYVLSTGPIIMMEKKGLISASSPAGQILSGFYLPVRWVIEETPLHKPFGMYWHLWDPDHFDRGGNWK